MAIKTSGKVIIIHDSSAWSFHMRRLRDVLHRSSQAGSVNLVLNRWGEFHSRRGFWTFSELRSDQNPEVTHSLGSYLPSK
eukprot:209809-Amphidinium_carterae.1